MACRLKQSRAAPVTRPGRRPLHIDITAESGPGNLLGNLLCALAGLLDHGGPLGKLARKLDRSFNNLAA